MNDNFEFYGIARDILDDFAATQGITFEYKPLPVERLFRALLAQEVDFKYPDHPAWAKVLKADTDITYSLPVMEYTDGILLYPYQGKLQVEQIKQLATILGFTLLPFWQNRVESGLVKRIDVKHYDSLLLMALVGNRVDGIYANVDVGLYRLQQIRQGKYYVPLPEQVKNSEQTLVFAPELPNDRSYYYLSTVKQVALMTAFNQYLTTHVEAINALKRQYNLIN